MCTFSFTPRPTIKIDFALFVICVIIVNKVYFYFNNILVIVYDKYKHYVLINEFIFY